MMVLQQQDAPAGLNLLEEDGETRGFVEPLYDPRAMTMFIRAFERPREEAALGSVVCIGNSVLVYETPQDARDTFRELEELQDAFEQFQQEVEGSESDSTSSEIDSSSLPQLGDEVKVIRFADPDPTTHCSSYDGEPSEGYVVVVLRRNVAAGLFVYTYERGASLDEAIELAQTQANRIEEVFAGEVE